MCMTNLNIHVIITAGGTGYRMGAPIPKQYLHIGSETILEKTVHCFLRQRLTGRLVLTVPENHLPETRQIFENLDASSRIDIIAGGTHRQDSVRNALEFLKSHGAAPDDLVLVQDGVRPFTEDRTIQDVIEKTKACGAAIAAIPVTDTIRHETEGTLKRSELYAVQTPQGFKFGILAEAYDRAYAEGFRGTDEAGLVERIGILPEIAEGSRTNVKITTPEDLRGVTMKTRIGTGFDVHRLVEGRPLILGGIEIPYELGLLGHSDADVLTHALMDAMLGAAALGDIGKFFPDNDPAYEGADSTRLLKEVCRVLGEHGWAVGNADITVICQKPKLAEHIPEMKKRLADVMQIDVSDVSIKATTTEKLGFTGRGEGIAAEAVCLLENKNPFC